MPWIIFLLVSLASFSLYSADIELVPTLTEHRFDSPVFLTAYPSNPNIICILEKSGRIKTVDTTTNESRVLLDIQERVVDGGEQGLLGMAFAPDFEESGLLYVYYSAGNPRRSVVSSFQVDSFEADPASEQVIIEIQQPYPNHNGGMISFGPDDYLYIGLGDGGSGGDPDGHGQNKSTLLGSILRIEPNATGGYRIPSDNPFVDEPEARPEIWAYGLRNPWRFSFDQVTGNLWLADVGQGRFEEINLVSKGDNLGWKLFEGRSVYSGDGVTSGFKMPIHTYPRSEGYSVTGGYVYRGQEAPSIYGHYIYGDYGSGKVWALKQESNGRIENIEIARLPGLASFGQDSNLNLYLLSISSGRIFRLQEVDPIPSALSPMPRLLSDTGYVQNMERMEVDGSFYSYEVNLSFWSDGANKRRWFRLPRGEQIDFSEIGAWDFPIGSIAIKHFDYPTGEGRARKIETRVLRRESSGWRSYTYLWGDDQSEAVLTDGPLDLRFSAGSKYINWYIPAEWECFYCHNSQAGEVLGLRAAQTNLRVNSRNQLESWNNEGLFSSDIGDPEDLPRMFASMDLTASVQDRARSYLDVNCAYCHQPGGIAPTQMDFRFSTSNQEMMVISERASNGDLGIPNAQRVKAGSHLESVVWQRMRRRGPFQMPPLSTSQVDPAGLELIAEWINQLESE